MKDYLAILNDLRRHEEETITNHLSKCHVARIKYDVIIFELRMYMPIDLQLPIPGYEYCGMYIPETHIPKRSNKINKKFPPPLTIYRIYYYKNLTTGNIVEISESSKKIYDKQNIPYSSVRVKFKSNADNVMLKDISAFLSYIHRQYFYFIKDIKDSQSDRKFNDPRDALLHVYPFHIFYAEPCIDITGPKESIDFLHKNVYPNLYMTRCRRRESFSKNNNHKKPTSDGRILDNQNTTDYISTKIRLYRYIKKKNNEHFLRFEFKFDKSFLRKKDIWLPEEYKDNFNPLEIWQNRCSFFTFNLPKIARCVQRKDPELVERIMAFIMEKQFKEDGSEYTDFEKVLELLNYKFNGKKLFKSTKEFLLPKWLTLYNLISKSLQQLSLNNQPTLNIEIDPIKVDAIADRKTKTQERIIAAVSKLKEKGIAGTYSNIMKEAGIGSRATLSRNRHLIKQL
jgi:hypothetical protein